MQIQKTFSLESIFEGNEKLCNVIRNQKRIGKTEKDIFTDYTYYKIYEHERIQHLAEDRRYLNLIADFKNLIEKTKQIERL